MVAGLRYVRSRMFVLCSPPIRNRSGVNRSRDRDRHRMAETPQGARGAARSAASRARSEGIAKLGRKFAKSAKLMFVHGMRGYCIFTRNGVWSHVDMSDDLRKAVKLAIDGEEWARAIDLLLDPVCYLAGQPMMNERLIKEDGRLNANVEWLLTHATFDTPLPVYLIGSPNVPSKPIDEASSCGEAAQVAAESCRCEVRELGKPPQMRWNRDGDAYFEVHVPSSYEPVAPAPNG